MQVNGPVRQKKTKTKNNRSRKSKGGKGGRRDLEGSS